MDDLIRRQDAIDAIQKGLEMTSGAIRCGIRLSQDIIKNLPSAHPECQTAMKE